MGEKALSVRKFIIPREVYICALIEFLTTFGTAITAVPVTRLIEGAVCQRYYGTESNLAEHICKADGVQSSLAYLLGGYSSLISLPGLFLAIPFGIASEYVDRRLILLVNSMSAVLENIFLVAICKFLPQSKLPYSKFDSRCPTPFELETHLAVRNIRNLGRRSGDPFNAHPYNHRGGSSSSTSVTITQHYGRK
jgi:hypothetical protein